MASTAAFTARQQVLSILPHFTAAASMFGSLNILVDLRKIRQKNGGELKMYHRLMIGMSAYDIFSSLAFFMTTWPMPKDADPPFYAAFGNAQSCEAQGFLVQFGVGTTCYNMCLSIYYYLVVGRGLSDKSRIMKKIETAMHIYCVILGSGTAIAGMVIGIYGPAELWCWISRDYDVYRWAFYYGPIWVHIFGVMGCMTAMYLKVRGQEKKQQRWSIASVTPGSTVAGDSHLTPAPGFTSRKTPPAVRSSSLASSSTTGRTRSSMRFSITIRHDEDNIPTENKLGSTVFWQAVWYVASFYATYTFITIKRALEAANRAVPFAVSLLAAILVPIEGCCNYFVYMRPRFLKYRKSHPLEGRLTAMLYTNPMLSYVLSWVDASKCDECWGSLASFCSWQKCENRRSQASASDKPSPIIGQSLSPILGSSAAGSDYSSKKCKGQKSSPVNETSNNQNGITDRSDVSNAVKIVTTMETPSDDERGDDPADDDVVNEVLV